MRSRFSTHTQDIAPLLEYARPEGCLQLFVCRSAAVIYGVHMTWPAGEHPHVCALLYVPASTLPPVSPPRPHPKVPDVRAL